VRYVFLPSESLNISVLPTTVWHVFPSLPEVYGCQLSFPSAGWKRVSDDKERKKASVSLPMSFRLLPDCTHAHRGELP